MRYSNMEVMGSWSQLTIHRHIFFYSWQPAFISEGEEVKKGLHSDKTLATKANKMHELFLIAN